MSIPLRAWAVVDLGFGDAGKGLLTDYLVRRNDADLVVRFNGGSQAGHNVVCPDGRHHTFSQFASGSFVNGVRTILSRYVAVHPTALLLEGRILQDKGLSDIFSRILVSERAMLVTPYHQAAGRLRELSRGADRHGSCGVGFGEAVSDRLVSVDQVLHAADLFDRSRLRRGLSRVKERMWSEVESLTKINLDSREALQELSVFERAEVSEAWIDKAVRLVDMGIVASEEALTLCIREAGNIVFEGAQGVILDEIAGFHPYTTWSRCTFDNADKIMSTTLPSVRLVRVGVTRAFAVRHGPGPFPTEDSTLNQAVTDHNGLNPWQGNVRYGWFDAVLMRYALDVTGPLDALAVTHLDVPSRAGEWKIAESYVVPKIDKPQEFFSEKTGDGSYSRILKAKTPSLEMQSRLARILSKVTPRYLKCQAAEESVLQSIEQQLLIKINLYSKGPTAGHVIWRKDIGDTILNN